MAERRRDRRRPAPALVWKRSDFRESSRIVTLLSRDDGRLSVLAKGAHRPDSPCLGRLDFLNEVHATLSEDRGGLRTLLRVELVRERRALRQPHRFLAAMHLTELIDAAIFGDRLEPGLFDLLHGGLLLLERCPLAAIPHVVLGLELLYLQHSGALPELDRCGSCAADLQAGAFHAADGGLACRQHAPAPRLPVSNASLAHLQRLLQSPGRTWPALASERLPPQAVLLPGLWLQRALERPCRLRRQLFLLLPEPALDSAG